MASHSTASSSPEPEIVTKKTKKPKDKERKSKKAVKSAEIVDDEGDVAQPESTWTYQPPPGSVLLNHNVDNGEFDWDAVKDNEDVELWVIRVPEGIKPKHLKDMKLDAVSPSKTTVVGSLERKHAAYDVWSLGDDHPEQVGGEEVKGLSCLLPRQRKGGKLQIAPKPIARHLVVAARPPQPATANESQTSPVYKNPERYRHPTEVLKHRFMPVGSLAPAEESTDMDVDEVEAALQPSSRLPEAGEASPKKRKTAVEASHSPKKSKKAA